MTPKASDLIIYVDDEKPNRVVFEHSFGSRYRIQTAESAEEALDLLAREPAAVVITDQRMPDVTGNDLLTRVKALYPDVIRLVITAYSDFEPLLRAVNEGLVARYIIKPFDRAELDQLLAWALEAHRLGHYESALRVRLLEVERLATLGTIAGMTLHDFKSPLMSLSYNVQRLEQLSESIPTLRKLVKAHDTEMREADRERLEDLINELPELLEAMQATAILLRDMTNNLRKLSDPDPYTETRARPHDAIHYTVKACTSHIVKAGGTVEYEESKLPDVAMRPASLTQILINLVNNAAQAIQTRENPGGRIAIRATAGDDVVEIEIEDNGPGIPSDIREKIWHPFFTTRKGGSGLGLAQCIRLVREAGGEVHLDSEEGRGTTVRVVLPTADSAQDRENSA